MRSAVFLLTRPLILFGILLFLITTVSLFLVPRSEAQTAASSSLQTQIDQQNAQLQALQSEVAQLQAQLNTTSSQKQTLQSAIASLNLNIQKLTKSIALTNLQIDQKNLQIKGLSGSIATTSQGVLQTQAQVASSLRQLNILDAQPLIITLLSGGTLSSVFNEAEALSSLRIDLENKIQELSSLKTTLEANKFSAQSKRQELAVLQQNLSEQKQGVVITRASQNQLLQETKNKESAYQALIAQKKVQEAQFEQSLLNYESQLNLKIQPGGLPPAGSGVLQWPVAHTIITQYFGNTPFATANPQIYNGHGHDGIDLSASPGTPIMAARSGVVMGTGNTDLTCPGASFGKWVFIQHDDGLSTMYAHLSSILVSQGQQVTTGQVIAYSDTTGYAIGPHLHFGVYATQGSEISSWPTKNPYCLGKIYTMPVATLQAYLNPLSYLPPLPQ